MKRRPRETTFTMNPEVEIDVRDIVNECDFRVLMDCIGDCKTVADVMAYLPDDEIAEYCVEEEIVQNKSLDDHLLEVNDATYDSLLAAIRDKRLDMIRLAGMVTMDQIQSMVMANAPKRPAAWCEKMGIVIRDNDGFPDDTWNREMDRAEFLRRVRQCTVDDVTKIPDA